MARKNDATIAVFTGVGALAAVAAAVTAVYFGIKTYDAANATANEASSQERKLIAATAAESEGVAPLLRVGAPPAQSGSLIKAIPAGFAPIEKHAERLWVSTKFDRIIVPLENAGRSVALVVGAPIRVANCKTEPRALAEDSNFPFGQLASAVLSAGDAEQFDFVPGGRVNEAGVAPQTKLSSRAGLWWDYTYKSFGRGHNGAGPKGEGKLLIWYTDEGSTKLDWICTNFVQPPPRPAPRPGEWVANATVYGSVPAPATLGRL